MYKTKKYSAVVGNITVNIVSTIALAVLVLLFTSFSDTPLFRAELALTIPARP